MRGARSFLSEPGHRNVELMEIDGAAFVVDGWVIRGQQLTPFTEQVFQAFQSTPEFSHSFQITFPSGGFGGMLVKPWDERKRSIFPIQEEVAGKLMTVPGIRAPAFLPSALPSFRS